MSWDKEKLLEPNFHVYGKDDTKVMIYNMRKWPKKGIKKKKNLERKEIKKYITKRGNLDS